MNRSCAYCGSQGKLTREHIWPKGIIQRTNYGSRTTSKGKVISGELTIADVCAECNNGPLSKLDGYICELYDQYFYQFQDKTSLVEFQYDWWQLGNWFLKASFNAARAARNSNDISMLSKHVEFIRGIDSRQPDLAIWADLVEPSFILKQNDSGILIAKEMQPAMTRLAKIIIPDFDLKNYVIRMIAINSFYFYIAAPVEPYMNPKLDELNRIVEFFSLLTLIDPETNVSYIKSSGLSFNNIVAPHFYQHKEAYRSFLEKHDDKGRPSKSK